MYIGTGEAVTKEEYYQLGYVTEFRYGSELGRAMRGNNPLKWYFDFGKYEKKRNIILKGSNICNYNLLYCRGELGSCTSPVCSRIQRQPRQSARTWCWWRERGDLQGAENVPSSSGLHAGMATWLPTHDLKLRFH